MRNGFKGELLQPGSAGADKEYDGAMNLLTRVRDRLSHGVHSGTSEPDRKIERRHAVTRPKDGDTRICPSCSELLLFRESYRIMRTGRNTVEPAWVCHTHPCGYREFVRR